MSECSMCLTEPRAEGSFLGNLFSTDFVARADCIGQRAEIIWLHVASDATIALAYYSIPLALWWFTKRRTDLVFRWMFLLFAGFIFFCGTTHVFNILAFWYPMYRLDGVVKAGTGVVSMFTAFALWPLLRRAEHLPSPNALREANEALEREVGERRRAEAALSLANTGLEERVRERTARLDDANRQMIAQLAELEAVYQAAAIGLCQLDRDGRLTRSNAEFRVLTGIRTADGERPRLVDALPELEGVLRGTGEEDGPAGERTPVRIGRPGQELDWLMGIRPVRTPDGTLLGHSVAIKDVTETMRLERQARQSQKMEAIGQLASGVAHDINNTLTAIYGYLSLVRAQLAPNHAAAVSLDKIAVAAEQTARMTKALLTFSRPAATVREPVELTAALTHALELAKGLMPARIEISEDLTPTRGVYVRADATQLQQVLLNLAINARDAMPAGGRLRITTGVSNGHVTLTVADTGTGIAEELLPKIFDPFFTTKPRGEGTGLGLSIVHGIVTAHGGTIDVASVPGEGTAFTVTLARVDAPPPASRAEATPDVVVKIGATVVLADDNVHVRELLAMQVRRSGYNVLEARDGVEMLRLARQHAGSISAYIVDVDMPNKTGTECLRVLRSEGDRVPAVLITGGREPDGPPDAYTIILNKPFSGSVLLRAISTLVTEPRGSDKPGETRPD